MSEIIPDQGSCISPDMTVLDVVSRHRETEAVFKKYEEQAGACICCEALFDPLKIVAEKYGLDLKQIISDLESAASDNSSCGDNSCEEKHAHVAVDGEKSQVDPFEFPS